MRASALVCAALATVLSAAAGAKPAAPTPKAAEAAPEKKAKPADLDLPVGLELEPLQPTKAAEPAPAPAPAAEPAPAEPPPAPEEPPAPARPLIVATPLVGFGYAPEPAVGDAAPLFLFGASGEYNFLKDSTVRLSVRDQIYRRTYLTTAPDLDGHQAAAVALDEHRIALDLLYAHELLRLFKVKDTRFRAAPMAGVSMRFFHNDALRTNYGTLAVGARGSFAPSDQLDVRASYLWGYNFFFNNDEARTALGGPKQSSEWEASLGLKLAPHTRLGIGYQGDVMTLRSSYRLSHALVFSFDLAF